MLVSIKGMKLKIDFLDKIEINFIYDVSLSLSKTL